MKLVIAFIQTPKLSAVVAALRRIGVERLTICDALGFGQQGGHISSPRAEVPGGVPAATSTPPPKLLRKAELQIVVNDDFLDRTIQTIEELARSGSGGSIGDGKILVLPVEEAIQLDDGHRGPGAV